VGINRSAGLRWGLAGAFRGSGREFSEFPSSSPTTRVGALHRVFPRRQRDRFLALSPGMRTKPSPAF